MHSAVLKERRLLVHRLVGWQQLVARHVAHRLQVQVKRLPRVVCEVRQRAQRLGVEHVVEQEANITIVKERVRLRHT
jgi:hypothetical protein